MAEDEQEFATTGTIERLPIEEDAMAALMAGRELPEGKYQIGPYTVTPSNDESGMLDYVVRMQDALQEAVQTLHEKEVRINQLSQQLSQVTEEKSHVTSKLNAVTRTVQEKDQRMRVATNEVQSLERRYKALEEEEPRKAASAAKKQLTASRKDVSELKKSQRKLQEELKAAQDMVAPLEVKCGAQEEQLQAAMGRYNALEEQRGAAQEQVSALTWKLQAFEQQYAALYQQYATTIRADSPDQEADIPRDLSVEALLPPPSASQILPPPTTKAYTSVEFSSQGAPHEPSGRDSDPLIPGGSCSQCGSSGSEKTRIDGTIHRRRNALPIWLPERLIGALSMRSAPRIKMIFSGYLILIHLYLVFFCLLGS